MSPAAYDDSGSVVMGRPVSASSAALFATHELPRSEPVDSIAEQFATWWRERCEAERIIPQDVDFAIKVLGAGLAPEARAALLSELLLHLPFDLTWKARELLKTADSHAVAIEGLRRLVVSWQFDGRDNVASWLIERKALGVTELGLLLEDSSCRYSAATALESFSVDALQSLGGTLVPLAAAEKGKHTRRALAKLVRKILGRQKPGKADELDAAALAARIAADWDAGGNRAASRRRLAALAEMADGSGLVQLLALRQRAASLSLREACQPLLDAAGDALPLDAALTAELRRLPAGAERKAIEWLVIARIEEAMVAERPLPSDRLVAQLSELGPNRALLVRTPHEGEPWLLKASASPPLEDVTIVHPASVTDSTLQATTERAKREGLSIAGDQLTRPVFRLAPHQRGEKRFELDVPSPRHPGSLLANGWRPADCESFDPHDSHYNSFSMSTKLFASVGVQAHWEHTPMYPNSPDEEQPDNDEWLTFWDTSQPPQQLELGQVPPIVFSELLLELTPKGARSRDEATRRAKPAAKRARTKAAPASNTACTDEILGLASRLARTAEGRADALRLVDTLDERARNLIEAFTSGKARSDAEACALLGFTPGELTELTEVILRTFTPVLRP